MSCYSGMLLLPPALCSGLLLVRDVKPALDFLNTLPLSHRRRQVCFFWDFAAFYPAFLDSISWIFTAHWENPDQLLKPTGQAVNWEGEQRECVHVCNRKVMSGGRDRLLPLCVPTFNVWKGGRKMESERREATWSHGVLQPAWLYLCLNKTWKTWKTYESFTT